MIQKSWKTTRALSTLAIYIAVLLIASLVKLPSASAGWYNTNYLYRQPITLSSSMVSGGASLTSFPLLVSVTENALKTTANGGNMQNSNGYDLMFTGSDGQTPLNYETESYNASTGQLIAWVNIPTLSYSANTVIYLYYDNSSISTFQGNVNATWNSNYTGVWHLPNGTTLTTNDSTGNANNGTNNGATAASGEIGGGASFNGTSSNISAPLSATTAPTVNGNLTISGWFYVPSAAGFGTRDILTLYDSAGNGTADQFRITTGGDLQVGEWGGTTAITGTHTITTNAWHYAALTYNGTVASLYLDGALDNSATVALQTGTATTAYIGTYKSGEYWNGSLDELRLSNTNRSAGWIATEYANQSAPSTYEAFGAVQSLQSYDSNSSAWYNTNYLYRQPITLSSSMVSGGASLTSFPLLVSVTENALKTTANGGNMQNSNGYDLMFTGSDGQTPLNYETESYNASTGQLIAWVNIPTLSYSANTVIYLYYDNSSISTFQGNVNATWNSNYTGVWHLPNGTTLTTNDSTGNANNGTNNGATAASGEIGGGASFNGTSSNISAPLSATTAPTVNGNLTISGWFYVPSAAGFGTRDILTLYDSAGNGTADQFRITTGGDLQVGEWGGTTAITGTHTITTNAWHYAALTYNGTVASLYLDGALDNSATVALQTGTATTAYIGTYKSGEYWNGSLDELRLSNTNRSAGWIATEYANQSAPSTYEAFGAVQALPNAPTNLTQTNVRSISNGGYDNSTSITFSATASTTIASDTLSLCIENETNATAFNYNPTSCGSGVSYTGSPVTVSVTITGLSNQTAYHWQANVESANNLYSNWTVFNSTTPNYIVDTTPPVAGTVYDGSTTGAETTYNNGSLSQLSANWSGFSDTFAGIANYYYSIGTTPGDTSVLGWTSTTNTAVTATSLSLQTGKAYYFNVYAIDNAGNSSSIVSSGGQLVAPTLSFSVSPSNLVFNNLTAANSWTDNENTTLSASSNAYNGFVIRAYLAQPLSNGSFTIPAFTGGSYASPNSWNVLYTGFGYTSSDNSINGQNIYQSSPCPGGGTYMAPGCYAPFSTTAPGDIVADQAGNVVGTPASGTYTIYNRITVNNTQAARSYTGLIVYSMTANY